MSAVTAFERSTCLSQSDIPSNKLDLWNTVTSRFIDGVGQKGPYLENLLKNIVLCDFNCGASSYCLNQGPRNSPIVVVGNVKNRTHLFEFVDALSDAIYYMHNSSEFEPCEAARAVGRYIFDDCANGNFRIEEKAISKRWLMGLLNGYIRTDDFDETKNIILIDNNSIECVEPSSLSVATRKKLYDLSRMGEEAMDDLQGGQLNLRPSEWLSKNSVQQEEITVHESRDISRFNSFLAIGAAIRLLASSGYHNQFELSFYLSSEIVPPLKYEQIRIYYDTSGTPIGIVTWGRLTTEVLQEIQHSGRSIGSSEWVQGRELFFNDLILNGVNVRTIFRDLRQHIPDRDGAASLRRHQNTGVRRRNTWRRKELK